MPIRPNHPLRILFRELVTRHVAAGSEVQTYVAGVLADFVHAENLYRFRSARGKRLDDVGEMLLESNPMFEARSFDREREVRKHIGDYTLFLSGLFPEYVKDLPRRGLRLDALIDYVKAGKESYRIVSFFDQFEYRHEAPLFRQLSDSFELCVFGLNQAKQELEQMRKDHYSRWRATLLS